MYFLFNVYPHGSFQSDLLSFYFTQFRYRKKRIHLLNFPVQDAKCSLGKEASSPSQVSVSAQSWAMVTLLCRGLSLPSSTFFLSSCCSRRGTVSEVEMAKIVPKNPWCCPVSEHQSTEQVKQTPSVSCAVGAAGICPGGAVKSSSKPCDFSG